MSVGIGRAASYVLPQPARKLMAFFHGRRSAFVDVSGQIGKMHAALRLLARLDRRAIFSELSHESDKLLLSV